jgi:hypothetical protein
MSNTAGYDELSAAEIASIAAMAIAFKVPHRTVAIRFAVTIGRALLAAEVERAEFAARRKPK